MRNYFIVADIKNNKYFLYWEFVGSNILGAVLCFAEKQNTKINQIRVYSCRTRKEWEAFGNSNFSNVIAWRCK